MGNLRSEEGRKGQFLLGTILASQATLKALNCNFRSFRNDFLAAEKSGNTHQRCSLCSQPVATPRHTVGIITDAPFPYPSGSCRDYAPFQNQVNVVTSFGDDGDADEEDAHVFLEQ